MPSYSTYRARQSWTLFSQVFSFNGNRVNFNQARGMKVYKEKMIKSMYWRARSFDVVKYPKTKRSDFLDWNYGSEIFAFSRRLQENLSEDTLRNIFTYPSYVESMKQMVRQYDLPQIQSKTNEKFVDKGYQLMNNFLPQYLRYHLPKLPEEGIKAIVSYLTSEKVLSDVAKWIGCNNLLLTAESPPSPTSLASSVPAVIAGVHQDLGLERSQRFMVDFIITYLHDKSLGVDIWNIPHPRETLNKILRNSQYPAYEPRIVFQTGIKTLEACHIIGVYCDRQLLGSSAGETLEIAEDCACYDALLGIFDLKDSSPPLVYGHKSEGIVYSQYDKPRDSIIDYKIRL